MYDRAKQEEAADKLSAFINKASKTHKGDTQLKIVLEDLDLDVTLLDLILVLAWLFGVTRKDVEDFGSLKMQDSSARI